MVYFQCELCFETLKKKQIEGHYQFRCRNAHSFSCLTCYTNFTRETIGAHTSCVSEDQKYKSTDKKFQNSLTQKSQANGTNGTEKNKAASILKKIEESLLNDEDIKELKWSGFRKTAFMLFSKLNIKELKVSELNRYLMKIYVQAKKDDTIDQDDFKKALLKKIKGDERFNIK